MSVIRPCSVRGRAGTFDSTTKQPYQLIRAREVASCATSSVKISFDLWAGSQVIAASIVVGATLQSFLFLGGAASSVTGARGMVVSDTLALSTPLAKGDSYELRYYVLSAGGRTNGLIANGPLYHGPDYATLDSDGYEEGATLDGALTAKVTTLGATIAVGAAQKSIFHAALIAQDAPDGTPAVILTGNSITDGGTTGNQAWFAGAYQSGLQGRLIGSVNMGEDSTKITTAQGQVDGPENPAFVYFKDKATHFVNAHGVNDLRGGEYSTASYKTAAIALFAAVKLAAPALLCAISTVTPFDTRWSDTVPNWGTRNAQRVILNNNLRTYAAAQAAGVEWGDIPGCHYLLDPDVIVGQQGAMGTETMLDPNLIYDGIHPTAGSALEMGAIIWDGVFPSSPYSPRISRGQIDTSGGFADFRIAASGLVAWHKITPAVQADLSTAEISFWDDVGAPATRTKVVACEIIPASVVEGSGSIVRPFLRCYLQSPHLAPASPQAGAYLAAMLTVPGCINPGRGIYFGGTDTYALVDDSTATPFEPAYSTITNQGFGGASGYPAGWQELQTYFDSQEANNLGQNGAGQMVTSGATGACLYAVHSTLRRDGRMTVNFGSRGTSTNNRFTIGLRLNRVAPYYVSSGGQLYLRGVNINLVSSSGTGKVIGRDGGTALGSIYLTDAYAATDHVGAIVEAQGATITVTPLRSTDGGATWANNGTKQSYTDATYVDETGYWGAGLHRDFWATPSEFTIENILIEALATDSTPPARGAIEVSKGGNIVLLPLTETGSLPIVPPEPAGTGGFSVSGRTVQGAWRFGYKSYALVLDSPVRQGEVVTASYIPGLVADGQGNALAGFSGVSVANNSEYTRSSSYGGWKIDVGLGIGL